MKKIIPAAMLVAAAWAVPVAGDVTLSTAGEPPATIGSALGALMGVETTSMAGMSAARVQRIAAPFTGPRRDAGPDLRRMDTTQFDAMPRARGGRHWRCLTEALYFEARGETPAGQYAVAEVILNRVDHASYPNSICAVVNQGTGRPYACQFTYTCDGLPETVGDRVAWHRLGHIARVMIDGAPRDLTNGATHYHATYVNPRWARVYPQTAAYGAHIFYRRQY